MALVKLNLIILKHVILHYKKTFGFTAFVLFQGKPLGPKLTACNKLSSKYLCNMHINYHDLVILNLLRQSSFLFK